jgi:hypothetical protein
MKLSAALIGGLAGACAVTIIHELLKRNDPEAPRLDKLGMEALSKGLEKADQPVPEQKDLFWWALGTDIIMNSLYYSLAGIGKRKDAMGKGSILGAAAGLGALFLPKPLGLSERHSNRTFKTKMMSMGLYMLGGLIASKVTEMMDRETS